MQVDFAATMAALLGVPIPYGSIGRISPQLWSLAGDAAGYSAALQSNAWQVLLCSLTAHIADCQA